MNKPPVPWGKPIRVRVKDLKPNPWNPNQMTDEQLEKEQASFERFGQVAPIIVRKNGSAGWEIIDGEQRWTIAQRLEMIELDAYDISPIGDHEAKQLTYILNELRGKPQGEKLEELLKGLLASSTLDDLIAVMPLSKEEFGRAAKLPEFNWSELEKLSSERAAWVERIFRMTKDQASTLDEALRTSKEALGGDTKDAEALADIAATYLRNP